MDQSAQGRAPRRADMAAAAVTRWHLVRHAPVIGAGKGALGLLYKTHDDPADTSDRPSYQWLASWLPKDAVLITSGLKRTEATADAFVAEGYVAAERHVDARFEEQFYGDWHGSGHSNMIRTAPMHNFWFHSAAEQPPGGESFLEVRERVSAALDDWSARAAGRNIVLVGHGGTFRACLAHAMGLDSERALTISVDNLSVTRVDHRPGAGAGGDWRTVYVNRRPG